MSSSEPQNAAGWSHHQLIADLQEFARLVVRFFYGPTVYIVLNALIAETYCENDELAKKLLLHPNQVAAQLELVKKHGLVKICEKRETRISEDGTTLQEFTGAANKNAVPGSGAKFALVKETNKKFRYWFINYGEFVDVIQWRLHALRAELRAEEEVEQAKVLLLVCKNPSCRTTYKQDQIADLMKFGAPKCKECRSDLDRNATPQRLREVQATLETLDRVLAPIETKLKAIQNLHGVIPHFNLADVDTETLANNRIKTQIAEKMIREGKPLPQELRAHTSHAIHNRNYAMGANRMDIEEGAALEAFDYAARERPEFLQVTEDRAVVLEREREEKKRRERLRARGEWNSDDEREAEEAQDGQTGGGSSLRQQLALTEEDKRKLDAYFQFTRKISANLDEARILEMIRAQSKPENLDANGNATSSSSSNSIQQQQEEQQQQQQENVEPVFSIGNGAEKKPFAKIDGKDIQRMTDDEYTAFHNYRKTHMFFDL